MHGKTERLEEAEVKEQKQHDDMMKRIVAMYEKGNSSMLQMIIEAGSIAEMLQNMENVQAVHEYDRKALNEYVAVKEEIAQLMCQEITEGVNGIKAGVIGEIDGVKIVKVPSSRLPAGCAFLLTHPSAAVGPKQLEDYKTHDNPPGISGWLVEGRVVYDCFVLEEKVILPEPEKKPAKKASTKKAAAKKTTEKKAAEKKTATKKTTRKTKKETAE